VTALVPFINWGVGTLGSIIDWILAHLPSDPFFPDSGTVAALQAVMGYAAYFLPIALFFSELTAIVGAITAWYVIRFLMRIEAFGFSIREGGG